ncbi:hypothetical protein AQPE_0934 [Aquipluma nitroreducens]|uniref:Uncharacterized protein n=1 Tax=Aquipluma nitroreducens TaxID=2010828 RepID=A0A5K7S5L2_9BACT|nr:hypothetical protein AQPE_0934 [Aquipluma nitroreducens]
MRSNGWLNSGTFHITNRKKVIGHPKNNFLMTNDFFFF